MASLAEPSFVLRTAISAGIFFGVAAIEHLKAAEHGRNETIAMVSDIGASIVLLGLR